MKTSLVRFIVGMFCWMGIVFAVQAIPADREATDPDVSVDVVDDSSNAASSQASADGIGDPTATPMPDYKRDYFSGYYDIWNNEVWYRYDEHYREDGGYEWYFVADAYFLSRPDSNGKPTDESSWMNVEEFKTRMGATR